MKKQELKEKILEIINNNYSEGCEARNDYFDMDTCTNEIEALFKEAE